MSGSLGFSSQDLRSHTQPPPGPHRTSKGGGKPGIHTQKCFPLTLKKKRRGERKNKSFFHIICPSYVWCTEPGLRTSAELGSPGPCTEPWVLSSARGFAVIQLLCEPGQRLLLPYPNKNLWLSLPKTPPWMLPVCLEGEKRTINTQQRQGCGFGVSVRALDLSPKIISTIG